MAQGFANILRGQPIFRCCSRYRSANLMLFVIEPANLSLATNSIHMGYVARGGEHSLVYGDVQGHLVYLPEWQALELCAVWDALV